MTENKGPVIVLDGPAGAGKSTVAGEIAARLALPFLDSGAIYRAIGLTMLRAGIPPHDSPALREKLRQFTLAFRDDRVVVHGEDVTDAIRTPEVDAAASAYSALPAVRDSVVDLQREQAKGGLVAEGRDMGTVIFPDADLKIFLTASAEARARRRYDQRREKGEDADYDEILDAVLERDRRDSARDVAPLKPAADAIVFDTTDFTFEQVVEKILDYAAELR